MRCKKVINPQCASTERSNSSVCVHSALHIKTDLQSAEMKALLGVSCLQLTPAVLSCHIVVPEHVWSYVCMYVCMYVSICCLCCSGTPRILRCDLGTENAHVAFFAAVPQKKWAGLLCAKFSLRKMCQTRYSLYGKRERSRI